MQTQNTDSTTKLSAIDKALAAAKARAAAKATVKAEDQPKVKEAKEPKVKKTENPEAAKTRKASASSELRNAAKAKLEEERAARKVTRDAARSARRAEKEAEKSNKKPAHMKKVMRAGNKLPVMTPDAARVMDEITTNLGRNDIAALALRLQHFNRMKATEMSMGRRFKNGQQVRIVAGDLDNLGKIGTIDSARPLRVFVNVPGVKKPVYVFTSEVELVEETSTKATGTEG
jgi:transcription antitermination factor NusG